MIINTPEDWWLLAEATLPALPEYAADQRTSWDAKTASALLAARTHAPLWQMFQDFWERLPDSPRIHVRPFYDLCDLCSENWVFEEGDITP